MKELIWYEKYRQKDIDDLSLNDHTREKMEEYIEEGQIPHLLFVGPPGSGKTTLAMILIDNCASSKLTLNASSEDRGVNVMKVKVKNFANSLRVKKNKTNIVLLDEAHGLTGDAQRALFNTIEKYHKNCRFIFTSNDIYAIDSAIQSRCTIFQFKQIPLVKIIKYCTKILRDENIKFSKDDIKYIVDKFYPDIRSVLNNLQACSIGGIINLKHLLENEINKEELFKLLDKGKIGEIRNKWTGMISFNWLWKSLMNDYIPKIKDNQAAAESALSIAEYMNRRGDPEINATACLIDICLNQKIKVILS